MPLKEKVYFNHFRGENLVRFFELNEKLRLVAVPKGCIAITSCTIVDEDNGNVRTGLSFCDRNDNFCKKTGRKISETRARSDKYLALSPVADVPLTILDPR